MINQVICFFISLFALQSQALSPNTVEFVVGIDMPYSPWCFLWGQFAAKLNVGSSQSYVMHYNTPTKTFEFVPETLDNLTLSMQSDMAFINKPNFNRYSPTSDYAYDNPCSSDDYDCTCWNSAAWTEPNSIQVVDLELGCRNYVVLECSACPRWHIDQLNVECVN